MEVLYKFYSYADLKNNALNGLKDDEGILSSGLGLYKDALLANPLVKEGDNYYAFCLAIVDGQIVGRHMLFPTLFKTGNITKIIQTGGGILLSEKYRGVGIGTALMNNVSENDLFDLYYGALYSRAAYNIIKKTELMLEIPQFVKYRYKGLKKILDIPVYLRQTLLKMRYVIKKLTKVPEWAGSMATSGNYKYMEIHNTAWLQWSLDNNATGIKEDYQSFYAIFDKKEVPVGFFMIKVRHLEQEGTSYVKGNLVEWASSDLSKLDESDINILSLATYPPEVSRFWTISENEKTAKKLKCHLYKRRGWFAMSITRDDRFKDISDVKQWRIRYGCCNTALVQ